MVTLFSKALNIAWGLCDREKSTFIRKFENLIENRSFDFSKFEAFKGIFYGCTVIGDRVEKILNFHRRTRQFQTNAFGKCIDTMVLIK